MAERTINYENEVIFQGTVVHKYSTPKVTILTISTGRATNIVNYPKCVCFGKAKEEADKLELHARVAIQGNVQSSVRTREERRYVTQSIYADEITEIPNASERANYVKLTGEVVSIATPAENILRLVVRTFKNGRRSNVQVFRFDEKAGDIAASLKNGDVVSLVGTVQTTKKEKAVEGSEDKETIHYENIVIRSLSKKED